MKKYYGSEVTPEVILKTIIIFKDNISVQTINIELDFF